MHRKTPPHLYHPSTPLSLCRVSTPAVLEPLARAGSHGAAGRALRAGRLSASATAPLGTLSFVARARATRPPPGHPAQRTTLQHTLVLLPIDKGVATSRGVGVGEGWLEVGVDLQCTRVYSVTHCFDVQTHIIIS